MEIIYLPSGTGIKYHNVNIGLHRTSGGEEVSLPIPSCQGEYTTGEISSDLYRSVQCDIKKRDIDSLKLEQNPWNCD